MKFIVNNKTGYQPSVVLRNLGYTFFQQDPRTKEMFFIKSLGQDFYPRFHLILQNQKNDELYFSLHLDQKKPIYKEAPAHSGEYNGDIIKKETIRIKQAFNS